MATVEVTFTPLPVHVRTARLIATAVARRSGVAESLLDEVRLAVGEACSRAVEAHLRHCPGEPIRVVLTDDEDQFEVVVTDATAGMGQNVPGGSAEDDSSAEPAGLGEDFVVDGEVPLRLPEGVGLAVIAGLADDVRITSVGAGTSVTMSWKRRAVLCARWQKPPSYRAHNTALSPGGDPRTPDVAFGHKPGWGLC
jgi:serine/threonine-protein kinase RsbW